MIHSNPAVFVLADSASFREVLHQALKSGELRPTFLATAAEYFALAGADGTEAACLLVDADRPDMTAAEFQKQLKARRPADAVVFLSRRLDIAESVRAMKAGAIDYLVAPVEEACVLRAVEAAVERCRDIQARSAKLASLQLRYARLTPRERETLQLIASGLLNKQAASVLGISAATLQVHRGRIAYKMRARSFAELVRMAEALDVTRPAGPARGFIPRGC